MEDDFFAKMIQEELKGQQKTDKKTSKAEPTKNAVHDTAFKKHK